MRYRWENCPASVRRQVEEVVDCVRENLNGNLVAIYLHGSIAMGCFNPRAGDIDLLVVSMETIARGARRAIVNCLLRVSSRPVPIEATFVSREQLRRWRYPTPFEVHFSESWREKYTNGWIARWLIRPSLEIPILQFRFRPSCSEGNAFTDVPRRGCCRACPIRTRPRRWCRTFTGRESGF